MATAAAPPTMMVDDDVEMVLEAELNEDPQPEFIFMLINSLAEGGPASLRPPIFREALGPREDVVPDVPDVPEEEEEDVVPDSPASPDPFGDEGSDSDAESDVSMASTIVWYPGHPRALIDSGMSEADEAESSDDEEDEGRLVMDLDSPRSPSPPPPSDDEEDDEDERSYYLALYQSSLQQYIGLLLQSPRQP